MAAPHGSRLTDNGTAPAARRRALELIRVPSALGAPGRGNEAGPDALLAAGLAAMLANDGTAVRLGAVVPPPDPAGKPRTQQRWDALAALCGHLAAESAASLRAHRVPLVLGGDHSIAVGTWRGVAAGLKAPLGLLWIDAHLDAHTPEDSPSGNPHGMPVAMLLGEGDPRLAQPTIAPRHLCLLGARSWETAERERLARLCVRVIDHAEMWRRGAAAALAEAVSVVTAGTAGFGVSFDLDAFDPMEAPAVSSPAPGGLPAETWLTALRGLGRHRQCRGVELVECEPHRDRDGRSVTLACRLAQALFAADPPPGGRGDREPRTPDMAETLSDGKPASVTA